MPFKENDSQNSGQEILFNSYENRLILTFLPKKNIKNGIKVQLSENIITCDIIRGQTEYFLPIGLKVLKYGINNSK